MFSELKVTEIYCMADDIGKRNPFTTDHLHQASAIGYMYRNAN